MNLKEKEIKKGIKVHSIQTQKFKTNLIAVFLTLPIQRETVTKNSLLSAVLRRGSKNMPTSTQISQELEEMYGASFDNGIDKTGDNQVLKFYIESINDNYLPQKEENMLKTSIDKLLEIVFNPLTEDGIFKKEYVIQEKENIKRIIEGKSDNKARYAFERCIEEMYQNAPYSLYKYGMTSELDKINSQNLYEQYVNLIKNCKIDIFISGNIEKNIKDEIMENENIKKLEARKPIFIINNKETRKKEQKEEQVVNESSEVSQGKLILGLDILNENDKDKFTALVYNAILGGTPTSKMFQNVREKNSLAYTASSSFIRQKANIFIKCGIDIENYEKALKIIKEQLEDMKNGEFTDKNIEEAKNNIISTIKFIPDEQDTELMYYFSQELSGYEMGFEEYVEKVKEIKKEDIIELAKKIQINTIYFLKN